MTDQKPRSFSTEEYDKIAHYFLGISTQRRENIIIPRNMGPVSIKTNEEKMVEGFFESCTFKAVMSCVAGNNIGYYIIY
jgi:import inner membrane translocase subunit TIM22